MLALDQTGSKRKFTLKVPGTKPTVVTILDPSLQGTVEAADPTVTFVHVLRTADAFDVIKAQGAHVVLVSPRLALRETSSAMRRFIARSLGVSVVAVLGEADPSAYDAVLSLGACGIKQAVNLADREGWTHLRSLVAECTDATTACIVDGIEAATSAVSDEMRQFLVSLARTIRSTPTLRFFYTREAIGASSITSRFVRAKIAIPEDVLRHDALDLRGGVLRDGRRVGRGSR